ncbi:MAG: hypothetical protein WCD42_01860, partial [Rhizomicrobium sp.]
MPRLLYRVVFAVGVFWLACQPVSAGSAENEEAAKVALSDNAEMKAILDADQADRETQPIDWKIVAVADAKRQDQTRALL